MSFDAESCQPCEASARGVPPRALGRMQEGPAVSLNLVAMRIIYLVAILAAAGAALSREVTLQKDSRLDWWRNARFGLFIHWGLYSIPAGEWKGSKNHAEWIRETARIPLEEYENFVNQFNPVKFDADKWVRMAKDAGMKYIVITTKHHDGFALFDSKVSNFDVMATPFKRDIMKELSDASRNQGIKMGWYYSIMDWYQYDYLPRRNWENRPDSGADFRKYVEFLRAQVTELLTNYGPIGIMWFDGEWENTWNHKDGKALYDLCRKLQPNVIVNNRVDVGRDGMGGMTTGSKLAGDYGTPEQEVPATGLPGVDWETCMTMNDHWGFNKFDSNYKSSRELIRLLVDIVSKGGNFLLNVGPTPEGEFPSDAVARLRDLGAWMKRNGEAIYGTSAGPFKNLPWGRSTAKPGVLYLQVFDWPADGVLTVPGIGNKVYDAKLLATGERLEVERNESDLKIKVPKKTPDANCAVIALRIQGAPIIYDAPEIIADSSIFVNSVNAQLKLSSKELEIRYTLDGSEPTLSSPKYKQPLRIVRTAALSARAFHRGKAVSPVARYSFTKATPAPAAQLSGVQPGAECAFYKGDWDKMPDFSKLRADETRIVDSIALTENPAKEYAGRVFGGYISLPNDDAYTFELASDDGAILYVDDKVVVNNDGLHSILAKKGVAALAKGFHKIRIEYFNKTGAAALSLRVAPLGSSLGPVSALFH